jgi:hypothetical protein
VTYLYNNSGMQMREMFQLFADSFVIADKTVRKSAKMASVSLYLLYHIFHILWSFLLALYPWNAM